MLLLGLIPSLSSYKFNGYILLSVVAVWLLVLGCTVSSIYTSVKKPLPRLLWILVVVFLPPFGTLIYLPFAFDKESVPEVLRKHKRPPKTLGASKGNTLS